MPPVRLDIQVSESGAPLVDKLAASVQKLGPQAQQATTGVQQLSQATQTLGQSTQQSHASFLSSTTSALGFATALTGVQLGVSTVGSVLQAAVANAASFQSGMANVSTLIVGPLSTGIGSLREQILTLPPAFGSSTELAKGLYGALSSGVEASKSVAFVGTAAQTAKAGLTTLSTAVDTLTTIQHAYNLQANDTARISDILFQTVNVGKGSFEQFSRAFSQVSPLAKNLGISLEEVGATLGTLSFAFPSASEAGTALNSLMLNLIQHSGDFAAQGINVKQTIGESGLTGLLKLLNERLQGSDAAIQKLIPDQEGFRAALALTGSFVERQTGNLKDMGAAAGATSEAFKKQTATASEALNNLIGSLERATQQAAPPFLAAFTGIANTLAGVVTVSTLAVSGAFSAASSGASLLVSGLDKLRAGFDGISREQINAVKGAAALADSHKTAAERARERVAAEQLLADKTQLSTAAAATLAAAQKTLADVLANGNATLQDRQQAEDRLAVASKASADATVARGKAEEDATAKTKAAAASINELEVFVNKQIDAQERLKNSAKESAQALQNAYAGLGQKTRDELKSTADAALSNFQKIQASGKEPPERLKLLWADALGEIRKYYSILPDHIKTINAEITKLPLPIQPLLTQLTTAFATFGDQSIFAVKKTADDMLLQFTKIKDGGLANTTQLQGYWEQTADAILKAYSSLPAAFADIGSDLTEQGEEVPNALAEAYAKFGSETQGEMGLLAKQSIEKFQLILEAGGQTAQQLLHDFQESIGDINRGELSQLPESFQAVATKIEPILKALGLQIQTTTDSLGHLTVALVPLGTALTSAATAATHAGEGLAFSGQAAEAAAANYRSATGSADGLENSLQGLSAAAIASGHSLNAAGEEVNKYGNAIAESLTNAEKLGQLIVKTTFATDKQGLFTQLATATKELQNVREHGEIEGTQGGRAFTIKALEQQIAAITDKIKALGFDTLGNPLKDAASKTTDLTNAVTTTNTTLQKTTTTAGQTAASVGLLANRFTDLAKSASAAVTAMQLVPGTGLLDPGRGTTSPVNPIPATRTINSSLTGAARPSSATLGASASSGSGSSLGSGISASLGAGGIFPTGFDASLTTGSRPGSLTQPGFTVEGIDPLTGRPYVPGLGSLNPSQSVTRFAAGGIVPGTGGVDSVLARLTPGERVQTPAQQQASDRVITISFGNIVIQMPQGTTLANLPTDRIAKQAIADALLPAIQEALRRAV